MAQYLMRISTALSGDPKIVPSSDTPSGLQYTLDSSGQIIAEFDDVSYLESLGFELVGSGGLPFPARQGVSDGSESQPGRVGEYKVTTRAVFTQLSSDVPKQICEINLTPGDWDIWGAVAFTPPANVSPNMVAVGVSTHPDDLPSADEILFGVGVANILTTSSLSSGQTQILMTGTCRSNSIEPLDLYLIAKTSFTAGGATVDTRGYICARRVR